MINERLKDRFSELQKELEDMPVTMSSDYLPMRYIEANVWQKWATSVEALIGAACGQHSPYYKTSSR